MKKLLTLPAIIAFGTLFLFTSCKKDKNESTGSDALTSGRAKISFNSSPNFAGSSSYYSFNETTSTAITSAAGPYRLITLTTGYTSGSSSITSNVVSIKLYVASDASTSSGNIAGDFDGSSTTLEPALDLVIDGSTFYEGESGTVTITKLTSTEVEGTFSGNIRELSPGSSNLTLTNGMFAGKF
ncbi:MAG: hypothetical protein ABIN36_16540 [Ferruginibacter sp.]